MSERSPQRNLSNDDPNITLGELFRRELSDEQIAELTGTSPDLIAAAGQHMLRNLYSKQVPPTSEQKDISDQLNSQT